MKWGHFDRVNSTFKMLLSSWNFDTVFKKIRSFDAKNLGSVGQRPAKLLAVKVGGLKKGLPASPGPSQPVCPGSNQSQSLMACNFAALWPTDPKFSAFKDLNPFKTVSKAHKTSSILRVGFALSKWPNFNSAYVIGFCIFFCHGYTTAFQPSRLFILAG